jgi:hypothetical protein
METTQWKKFPMRFDPAKYYSVRKFQQLLAGSTSLAKLAHALSLRCQVRLSNIADVRRRLPFRFFLAAVLTCWD